jgi:xanthine/CO dehydrogenase XdhC/CoxF family maturation factor
VLATLTLCTVQDLPAAVAEIRRVLRPDGQVLVLEHVLALDPALAAWQRRLSRPWGWVGAGCSPVRQTGEALSAHGFDVSSLRRLTVPGLPVTREWLVGRVTVPRE